MIEFVDAKRLHRFAEGTETVRWHNQLELSLVFEFGLAERKVLRRKGDEVFVFTVVISDIFCSNLDIYIGIHVYWTIHWDE